VPVSERASTSSPSVRRRQRALRGALVQRLPAQTRTRKPRATVVAPSTARDGGINSPAIFSGVGASAPPAKAASPLPVFTSEPALCAQRLALLADLAIDGMSGSGIASCPTPASCSRALRASRIFCFRSSIEGRLVAEPHHLLGRHGTIGIGEGLPGRHMQGIDDLLMFVEARGR
jgi:hypothetical protein